MSIEKVLLYTLQAMSGLLGGFIAYTSLKYLNLKALGMQTIFDQVIKDMIYICLSNYTCSIAIIVLVEFLTPVGHYVALFIVLCRFTLIIGAICQFGMTMIIRYMYVFHPAILSNEIIVIRHSCFKIWKLCNFVKSCWLSQNGFFVRYSVPYVVLHYTFSSNHNVHKS